MDQHSNEQKSDMETDETLTNRQGHPITNNQHIRTVGNRGPSTLENYDFLEKISHFDRERVPERVVHARGAGAHGYFEAYGTQAMSRSQNIREQNCFRKKGREPRCLSVFRR
ncbi:catalase [Bacillus paralicheniformis]|nr:catalase [Bacillus paralicheniformis]